MSNFTTWRSLVDGVGISAIPDSEVGQNTIAFYNFTDDDDTNVLEDQVGDFDATISGMNYVQDSDAGRIVGDFDGTDDSATGMGIPSLSEFSIGLVVKPRSVDDRGNALSLRDNNEFDIRYEDGDWQIGGPFDPITLSGSATTDTWQSVVCLWDGSEVTLSVDDDFEDSTSESSMQTDGEDDAIAESGRGGDRVDGRIAHVEISDQYEGDEFKENYHALLD